MDPNEGVFFQYFKEKVVKTYLAAQIQKNYVHFGVILS